MWERLVVALYSRAPERPRRWVVRLFTPGYRVGALAALVRPDGRLLLVDQPYVEGWNLPGGDLARGEQPGAGLARELREELGIEVEVGALTQATLRTHDRWVTFATRVDVPDEVADRAAARSPEVSGVGWFDPAHLPPLHGDAVGPLALLGLLPQPASR
jgi:ADP-ribose pyrophosphatase YjhB (NUDIX family)